MMRYFELLENLSENYLLEVRKPSRLFHYSKTELEIGTVLGPRGTFSVNPDIQAALEKYRPASELPRDKVVYMSNNTNDYQFFGLSDNGFNGHMYVVEPSMPLNRRDASIVGLLQKVYRKHQYSQMSSTPMGCEYFCWEDEEKLKEIIEAYWAGNPNPYYKKSRVLWEYTAPSAKIISEQKVF